MRLVSVIVSPLTGFAAALSATRDWLNRRNMEVAHFSCRSDNGAVVIHVGLKSDEAAAAFAAAFNGRLLSDFEMQEHFRRKCSPGARSNG